MEFQEIMQRLGIDANQVLEAIVTSDMPYVFVFKDMQIFRIYIVRPSGVHPGGLCHK